MLMLCYVTKEKRALKTQLKSHWSCIFMSSYSGKWTCFHCPTNQTPTSWTYAAILTTKIARRQNHFSLKKKKSLFEQIFVQQGFKSFFFFLITDKKDARCRLSCKENKKADTQGTGEKTLLHTLSSVFGEGRLNSHCSAKYFPKNSLFRREI